MPRPLAWKCLGRISEPKGNKQMVFGQDGDDDYDDNDDDDDDDDDEKRNE